MSTRKRPSTTSLPPSPQDDESSRMRNYLLTMGIRIACIVLMVVVQPFGWYTWLFGIGAVFLPYVAVVIANVGKDAHETTAENPERALPATAPPTAVATDTPNVIRVEETRTLPAAAATTDEPPGAEQSAPDDEQTDDGPHPADGQSTQ